MPLAYGIEPRADLWVPAQLQPEFTIHYFSVVARLRADIALQTAQQEVNAVATNLALTSHPGNRYKMTLTSIRERVLGNLDDVLLLWTLAAAIAWVLSGVNAVSSVARSSCRQR